MKRILIFKYIVDLENLDHVRPHKKLTRAEVRTYVLYF